MIALYQFLYGLFFIAVVPVFLFFFSAKVEVPFRGFQSQGIGGLVTAIGLLIMFRGMWEIYIVGKGLPMNAFPPKKLVTTGIYGIFPHPIYLGFCMGVLGVSIALGSATGLWLTTPLTALGCIALSVGYEDLYLKRTFGTLPRPLLSYRGILSPFFGVIGLRTLWEKAIQLSQILANSWSAKQIGRFRIINHFLYSALAGGLGAYLVIMWTGRAELVTTGTLIFVGLVGAALFGQLMLGSRNGLSRPFGYFGSLLGIGVAGLILSFYNQNTSVILAAFSLAAPWVQGIGRLRCLVQGCCHGAQTEAEKGIIVTNSHSRVCSLGNLQGIPIHPTQLYSILGNTCLGLVLIGWWKSGAGSSLIIGLYLFGSGVLRFLEESRRGEPMTPIIAKLRIYQWYSVFMVALGMGMMLINESKSPIWHGGDWLQAVSAGILFFLVTGLFMSTDFPNSNRRFSRLSG